MSTAQLSSYLNAEALHNCHCTYADGTYRFRFVQYNDNRRADSFTINIYIRDYGFDYDVRSLGQVLDGVRRFEQYKPEDYLECGELPSVSVLRCLLYERTEEFTNLAKQHIQRATRAAKVARAK